MKRRDFLKLIAVTPIAPSVLAAMPKKELTVAAAREFVRETVDSKPTILNWMRKIIDESPCQISHIFVSPNIQKRLTIAFEQTCFGTFYSDGFIRNIIFNGIPLSVSGYCKDDEIIIMNDISFNPFVRKLGRK